MTQGQLAEAIGCRGKDISRWENGHVEPGVLTVKKKAQVLGGDVPSPINPKPGCRFCGRCPYAKPICSEQTPAMKEAAPGHFVACHLY